MQSTIDWASSLLLNAARLRISRRRRRHRCVPLPWPGLVHGDLDPGTSKHHLTSLKHAYLKLRYLADMGCKFVGHGLKKDFRMANIVIPPTQVLYT